MVDVATQVPDSVFAGDLLAWTRDLSDYPASTWTLEYTLTNADEKLTISASADGDTHSVSVAAATTADYKAGRYRWFARVTNGLSIYTVEDGWIRILPDPTKKVDWRSHARKMLDAIEAALEGAASKDQLNLLNYSLGVVSVSRDRDLLWKARDKYLRELNNEDGTTSGRRHTFARFVRP